MKWFTIPVVAVLSLVAVQRGASACSFHNPLQNAPTLGATVQAGSQPLLPGMADAVLVDGAGASVAIEIVVPEVSYGDGKRVLWRPTTPLAAGTYTWRSTIGVEHSLDVDPSRDTAITLTAGEPAMVFRPSWMETCSAFGPIDSLDIVLSGVGIGTALVELSNEVGDTRVTVAVPTGEVWDNSDRDIGGPDANRRVANVYLWQAPLAWTEPTVCVKVRALNTFSALTDAIDLGCINTKSTAEAAPEATELDGTELSVERAEAPPIDDDEGCNGGALSPLALLGVLVLRRRT